MAFSADGSFAYVAGSSGNTGSVSAYSTCALAGEASGLLPNGTAPTTGVPMQLLTAPVVTHFNNQAGTCTVTTPQQNSCPISQNVYVFEPPNIQVLTAQFSQVSNALLTQPTQYSCNAPNIPNVNDFSVTANYTLPGGQFTPVYANLVNNGSELIVVARYIPSVYIFSNGTTQTIPLESSYDPRWASASEDGNFVFVAACDQYQSNSPTQPAPCIAGSLHVVNTSGNGTDQKVPYINNTTNNMCSGLGAGAPYCYPDLVAVKPH